jgi:hypothetical protein
MYQQKVITEVLGGIILGVLLESAFIRAMHPLTDAITRSSDFWPYTRIQRTAFSLWHCVRISASQISDFTCSSFSLASKLT